jgi:autophagy-related protein 9
MANVCLHTHWVPLYWRGRAHTASVRADFQGLFQLQAILVGQELLSVVLLPWICAVTLPRCADDVAKFLREVRFLLFSFMLPIEAVKDSPTFKFI